MKKIAILSLFSIFGIIKVSGQSVSFPIPDSIVYLSPKKISNYKGIEIIPIWPEDYKYLDFKHQKAEYCDNQTEFPNIFGQDRWVKHVVEPAMYVFQAPRQDKPNPAIIIYPGGGGMWVSIDREGFNVARKFNEMGITAIVVKYRTTPERFWNFRGNSKELEQIFSSILSDNQRALKIIQNRAPELNIAPEKIGVIGFSAGAWHCTQLLFASLVNNNKINDGIDKTNRRPDFACLVYGVQQNTIDLIKSTKLKTITPTYIISAKDDPIIKTEKCITAFEELKKIGCLTDTLLFKSGGHGWGYNTKISETNIWPEKFGEWLTKILILP